MPNEGTLLSPYALCCRDISISAPFPPSLHLHVSRVTLSISSSLFFQMSPCNYFAFSLTPFFHGFGTYSAKFVREKKMREEFNAFFHFGWLPVVLGLMPFPLCPPMRLMCGIRLTQHSEIYRWWICSQINLELSWQAHGSQQTIKDCSWSTIPLREERQIKRYHRPFSLSIRFRFRGIIMWMWFGGNWSGLI